MSEILNVLDVNNYGLQSMVAGSGGGGEVNLQSKDITINQNGTTTVTADQGYDGLSDVDVTVSGILDTSDATATASDMASGKTAYVNGEKVTGNVYVATTGVGGTTTNVTASSNFLTVKRNMPNRFIIPYGAPITNQVSFSFVAPVIGATAEKIKKDEVICGVAGTYEGLDTSDATATAGDMAEGKTAYVDGVKIEGNVEMVKSGNHALNTYAGLWSFPNPNCIATRVTFPQDYLCKKNSGTIAQTPYSEIVSKVNLTPNKLKKGEVVLGVTGTYEGTKVALPSGTVISFSNSRTKNLSWLTDIDTSGLASAYRMFSRMNTYDNAIKELPLFDTSNVTSMKEMCNYCGALVDFPLFNTNNVTDMNDMVSNCPNLSNNSLNNILAMCINAISYTGTKTLKYIGLSSTQATTCQTLSNWDAFVTAGWSSGYTS